MHRRAMVARWIVLLLVVVICHACVMPMAPPSNSASVGSMSSDGRIHILHTHLANRIRSLELRSARLHATLDSIRAANIDVIIGTPDLVEASTPMLGWQMAPQRVGEFAAVVDSATGAPMTLIVRIDLQRLANLQRSRTYRLLSWFSRSGQDAELDKLIDAILIHEIWGHLVPIAMAGTVDARCDDPLPGEKATDSCVMRRENDLRREMGLPLRTHYAVN
jgi:hypothetical protein